MQYTIRKQTDPAELRRKRVLAALTAARQLALLGLVASVVLSLYSFRGDILESYAAYRAGVQIAQGGGSARIHFDPDAANRYALYGTSLAVLNNGTYTLYNPGGETQLSLQHISTRPALSVSDSYVVLYNRGSPELTVTGLRSQVARLSMSGGVVSVQQNADGCIAVVHDDSRYRSVVSVYDNAQNLIYQWKTSEYYLLTAAVSPDGRSMAAVALTQDDAQFISRVISFDLSVEEYHAVTDIRGTLVSSLQFLDNQTLCAVGDDRALLIDLDGAEQNRYDFGGYMLRALTFGSGVCVLATVDVTSGLGSRLVSLAPGRENVVVETADEVRDLDLRGNWVGVLYTDAVEMRDTLLATPARPVTVYSVRRLFVTADGQALLIYAAEAGFVDIVTPFLPQAAG